MAWRATARKGCKPTASGASPPPAASPSTRRGSDSAGASAPLAVVRSWLPRPSRNLLLRCYRVQIRRGWQPVQPRPEVSPAMERSANPSTVMQAVATPGITRFNVVPLPHCSDEMRLWASLAKSLIPFHNFAPASRLVLAGEQFVALPADERPLALVREPARFVGFRCCRFIAFESPRHRCVPPVKLAVRLRVRLSAA